MAVVGRAYASASARRKAKALGVMTVNIINLADQIHHVEELSRLHHSEWGHLSPHVDLATRTTRLTEASGRSEIPTVFVAVDGSFLIGSVALVDNDMKNRPELSPWLAAVYVKPECRRSGIASMLISYAEEVAISLCVETLYLFTESQEEFYTRKGWKLIERADYFGFPVSVMKKRLFAGDGHG
ncbi:GNAT family N-acetyltransferase [Wenzhouxiangella sp. AB-CW3]|uniref:GNAT family N-acetyltransferase n=1 Tax=Wenzhouxiangella sp. AB-CW3 TaxID=2771012 RepID=UPI00168AF6C3|nr:GNAT family N-acetyltransferase [Wenzhouxiangella sp. AB-CW3]QOC22585.1 GNAT family N-acetyltransferase [Wenzhouxiangella sp. AB-CW3]